MDELVDIHPKDCHVHVSALDGLPDLMEVMGRSGLSTMSMLSIALVGDKSLNQNCIGLLAKALHPGKVYAFGCLWHPRTGTVQDPLNYEDQARGLIAAGCDGMKMLEGKPTERKLLQEPLDSPDYDSYYGYLESEGIPLLYHVGDPAVFWDPNAPEEVRNGPWFYADGSYPSREQIYQETENVLQGFPRLRVVFAHFYFLSGDLDRAGEFLDRHPSAGFDLAPGGEMYRNFTKQPDRAREFFARYQDRILFGSDNIAGSGGWQTGRDAAVAKIQAMRTFLETDRTIEWLGGQQQGIGLRPDVVSKIYRANFDRFAGEAPKAADLQRAIDECQRVIALAKTSPDRDEIMLELSVVESKLRQLQAGGPGAAGM